MFERSLESLNAKRTVSGSTSLTRSITPGTFEPSPSKKKWREILRPSKIYSFKQTGQFKRNATHGGSYISPAVDESRASKTPFPPMSVQEPLLTPPHLTPPSFECNMSPSKFVRAYSTPNTTPQSINFFDTPSNISGDSFSYTHQVHTEGLNMSFANILNNNVAHLNKRASSQSSSVKTSMSMKNLLDNICFICSELLLNVLQSERVLKLNCGDLVHFECFRTAFHKELASYKNTTNEPNMELSNLCHGSICKGEHLITIDNRNLNFFLKKPYTALTPKRPAPTQPKAKDDTASRESKATSQSINFKALRSTLGHSSQYFELSKRNSVRNRDTMISNIRSPSPVNTLSTTMTDSYNINGFDNGQSVETVVNQLMQYLLSNCTTLNLAKLSQLGMLRAADQLQIKIEDGVFREKYCYLFENSVVIWDKISQTIFIPVKNAKITCKGSIVTISPTEGDVLYFSLQSHLSSVIEKWAIVLMDLSVEVPGSKITNTIDLVPKVLEMNVFGGFLGNTMSSIIDLSQKNKYQLGNLHSHSMISTDLPNVKELNLTKTNMVMLMDANDDSDSDVDSDEELIQRSLKDNTERINLKELHSLISEVDQML